MTSRHYATFNNYDWLPLQENGLLPVQPSDPNWALLPVFHNMVKAIMTIQGCVGPLHLLFGMESLDANHTAQLLLPAQIPIIAQNCEAAKKIFTVIRLQFPQLQGLVCVLDLECATSLHQPGIHTHHDNTHGQLLLDFSKTECASLLGDGFIGYLANMLVMPTPLQLLTVSSAARGAQAGNTSTVSMRQIVERTIMHHAMLFDTFPSAEAFQERCKVVGDFPEKILCLDGGSINLQGIAWKQSPGAVRTESVLLFSAVDRLAQPLDMRLRMAQVGFTIFGIFLRTCGRICSWIKCVNSCNLPWKTCKKN